MTLLEVFEAAPKSERTLAKRKYIGLGGVRFLNDTDRGPCLYRIVTPDNVDLGAIKYYGGRLLTVYEIVKGESA